MHFFVTSVDKPDYSLSYYKTKHLFVSLIKKKMTTKKQLLSKVLFCRVILLTYLFVKTEARLKGASPLNIETGV